MAAHDAIVAGFDAVAATETANARLGLVTSATVSAPTRIRKASLRVACRDTAALDALLRALRNRAGAEDTETTIVLRSGPPRRP